MPVAILFPSGAGSLSEWNVSSGTDFAALAVGGAFLLSSTPGARVRVAMENLPGTATGINSVMQFGLLGADSGGDGSTVRLAVTLAGTDSLGAILTPPEGAYSEHSRSLALAPDGGAWSVAKVNALEAGADLVAATANMLFDAVWLAVDYAEAASDTPPEPWAEVEFPDTEAPEVNFGDTPEVEFPDTTAPDVDFGDDPEIEFPDTTSSPVEITPESS